MPDYPEVALAEGIARAKRALARVPTNPSDELVPLGLRCYDELNRIISTLTHLTAKAATGSPRKQSQRHRQYQRAVRDIEFIEGVGLTALERANEVDWRLNRLVKQIRKEIAYPLILPPAVTSISREYFYIHTRFNFNLLCVPPGEGYSLLHLADIYHELAHPLLLESHLPSTRPLRQGLTAIRDFVLEHFFSEIQEEERQRGPQEFSAYLELWMQCWYKHWATELICDLFATYTLGPAFAWAHVHLCAKRSSTAFAVPTETVLTHPADDARMQVMLFGLDRLGFKEESTAIEQRWLEVVKLVGSRRPTEYRRCYPRKLLAGIEDATYEAVSRTGCRIVGPGLQDFVHLTLNAAWQRFWEDSESYQKWEEGAVARLYEYCGSGTDNTSAKSGDSRLIEVAGSVESKQQKPNEFEPERALFADALTRLLRDIKINRAVQESHPLLSSDDTLGVSIVPEEPLQGGLYDHVVFERKFYLADRLLAAFRRWWEQNKTTLLEREQMCRLFFLHEFLHTRQHVDSNSYRYSVEADESFRYIDYDADAFAVKLSLILGDHTSRWIERLPLILAAHIKCGDTFRFAEDGQVANTIDGRRLQRQLLWHLQYARSRSFKPEAAFEEFEIEKHLIVDLYSFTAQGEMENLCLRESVEPSDIVTPIELNLVWGGRRIRHSLSLHHYTNNLMEGVFNANLQASAEAFRALFDEHPELIGRGTSTIATAH